MIANANMNIESSDEILLATADEFDDFVDDTTHLYRIDVKLLSEGAKNVI